MEKVYVILAVSMIIAVIISVLTILVIRKREKEKLLNSIGRLDIERNTIASMPVMVELSKIEEIAKSEQLEKKLTDLKNRYDIIKENNLVEINNMIIDMDIYIEKKDIRDFYDKYADIEIQLCETDYSINKILNEIEEIASYEEKYRGIITKLKVKYRYLEKDYKEKESLLGDLGNVVKLQLENIEKRFNDFDKVIEQKLYNEVILVVKAIDNMIDHLDIVLRELPDILILANDLIPGRIKDLKLEYEKLVNDEYPLNYLNFDKNINDIEKQIKNILDRAKVLSFDDSLFDLRTMLDYLDNLFHDFDKEKVAKKDFDDSNEIFREKLKKVEKVVKDIYDEMDDIKNLYDLKEKDLDIIDRINLKLASLIKEYKALLRDVKKCDTSYMKINIRLYDLINRLNSIDSEFDVAIKSLGSMYEDEMSAKEQLNEINEVLKKCKKKVREHHLPIVYDNYYVELNDVNEAIYEIVKVLDNKPLIIRDLNIRVETGKDLIFKLNNTVNNMIRYAYLTEILSVYANRYRNDKDFDHGLSKVEMLYYSGEYKEGFDLILKLLEIKEPGVTAKIYEYQLNN